MKIDLAVAKVRASEEVLTAELLSIANRHDREAGLRDGAKRRAEESRARAESIRAWAHGTHGESDEPHQVRAALFHGDRTGGLGALRDASDLFLLATQAEIAWTSLHQGVAALHDAARQKLCSDAVEEVRALVGWLRTQVKIRAPQALTVDANRGQELRASIPKTPTGATIPEAIWGPLAGAVLCAAVGFLGLAFGMPWLLPSVGATAYLVSALPAHPSTRVWNVVVGHVVAIAAGLAVVVLLGESALPAGKDPILNGARVIATALALGFTLAALLPLRAMHPPAGATVVLAAMGFLHTGRDVLALLLGVVAVAVLGEGVRRLRLSTAHPRTA